MGEGRRKRGKKKGEERGTLRGTIFRREGFRVARDLKKRPPRKKKKKNAFVSSEREQNKIPEKKLNKISVPV